MAYLTDVHHERRFNHFNLVDIYALGGSGIGPFAPLAHSFARHRSMGPRLSRISWGAQISWVAVQVGASDPMKAWRPELFGQTLAASAARPRSAASLSVPRKNGKPSTLLRRRTGSRGNRSRSVMQWKDLVTATRRRAVAVPGLLTNDTGPMHLAVGVGTPVIDLSVGHVDFRETGPYGPGHWMVQPDLGALPAGSIKSVFIMLCKDRLVPEQIASLCLHVLAGAASQSITGARIYRSYADEDGLGSTQLHAGREDSVIEWYGRFWRRFWFEEFTSRASQVPAHAEPAPRLG